MSKAITTQDWLKSVLTADIISGMSILLLSSEGSLQKLDSQIVPFLVNQSVDADSIKQNCILRLGMGCTGFPTIANENILICLGYSQSWAQIFIRIGLGGQIWFRIYEGATWYDWKQII